MFLVFLDLLPLARLLNPGRPSKGLLPLYITLQGGFDRLQYPNKLQSCWTFFT
jgi:hypothetical protein